MAPHHNQDCKCEKGGCPKSHGVQHALVGKPAPYFKGTVALPDGSFKEVSLNDYKGKYLLLYFYPLDFTYVCPSEIIAFGQAYKDFVAKGVEVLGCSVDSHFTHAAWVQTPREKGGLGSIQHPLLSDLTKQISRSYGVLAEEQGIALRGLFLIDKEGVIQHMLVNNLALGRAVEDAMRVVDALQHVEQYGEVCPAGWKKGAKGMKASAQGVADYLKSLA